MFKSESELGPPVVTWLQERGFEVFHEVAYGSRADLVGLAEHRPRRIVAVELKLALSFAVLEQAENWRKLAHHVYVAVPRVKRSDHGRRFAYQVAEEHGIGVIEIRKLSVSYGPTFEVRTAVPAAINRRIDDGLRNALRPEHKLMAQAGSARGGHWTQFKDTAWRLRDVVEKHPGGVPMKQALLELKTHHYSSDRSATQALVALARRGVIEGVAVELRGARGKQWVLVPAPPKPSK